MLELQALHVYALPSGRLVAAMSREDGNGFDLYHWVEWVSDREPILWTRTDGRIMNANMPTTWTVDDLTPTGETVYCGSCGEPAWKPEPQPNLEADFMWKGMARKHDPACEWIATRGFRIPKPQEP